MRTKLISLFILLCASLGWSQTTVNVTVTDGDGQNWNNGSFAIQLVNAPSKPPGPWNTLAGVPVSSAQTIGAISSSGTFSVALQPNANLAPAGSVYNMTVCAQSVPTPCLTQQIAVSVSSPQNLTFTPSPIRIGMNTPPYPSYVAAYADTEVSGALPGQIYYNLTTAATRQWTGSAWAGLTGSSSGAGGTTGQTQVNSGGALAGIPTGTSGQVLISNGAGVAPAFSDPIVSYAFTNLFTVALASTTQTSANVRVPLLSQAGTVFVTFSSITGSPAGCTLQLKNVDSNGNVIGNNGSALSLTVSNGSSQFTTLQGNTGGTSQEQAVYVCSTYPTGGFISVDYVPLPQTTISGTITTSPPANASTNVAQFGGTNTVTGTGASGAGIPRVTVSNDSSLAANQSINNNQVAGNAEATVAAGVQAVGVFDSNNHSVIACDHWTPFSLTASGQIITGVASKQTYICSINLVTATAQNIALVEGTGSTCATGIAGMAGGTTAATGWNFAANGGLTHGSGLGAVLRSATLADNVCLLLSSTGQTSGAVSWTQF